MLDIQYWSFNRSQAAELVNIPEATLGNWMTRYRLFDHKSAGRGHQISFVLGDLMTLEAIRSLIESGFEPAKAVEALRPYSSPWGSLLHGRCDISRTRYPGSTVLTRNTDGRWIGADGPDKIVAVEIRAWPIFDRVWPKIREMILASPAASRGKAVSEALQAFERQVEQHRAEVWSL